MIRNFLSGIINRGPEHARTDAKAKQDTALPCIGRKSDLIPVNADIGRIVSPRPNTVNTYVRIVAQILGTLRYDRTAITILNRERDTFRIAFVSGAAFEGMEQGSVFPLRDSFASEVADSRRTIRPNPLMKYSDRETFVTSGLLSHIATPLISNDQVIGTLHLGSSKPDAYNDQDLIDLERVGRQIAAAVHDSILEQDRTSQLEALCRVAAILGRPQISETNT